MLAMKPERVEFRLRVAPSVSVEKTEPKPEPEEPTEEPGVSKFTVGQVVITTSGVNIREEPRLSGKSIAFPNAGVVGVIEQADGIVADGYIWARVKWDAGWEGYSVESRLAAHTRPGDEPLPEPEPEPDRVEVAQLKARITELEADLRAANAALAELSRKVLSVISAITDLREGI